MMVALRPTRGIVEVEKVIVGQKSLANIACQVFKRDSLKAIRQPSFVLLIYFWGDQVRTKQIFDFIMLLNKLRQM